MAQPAMTPEEALREATRRQKTAVDAAREAARYTVEERPTRPGEAEEGAGSGVGAMPAQ